MVYKGNLAIDPRGLIYESYRIEGITLGECRSIFLDWAMEYNRGDTQSELRMLLVEYGDIHPDHPMTQILKEGLEAAPQKKRRGGRIGRQSQA